MRRVNEIMSCRELAKKQDLVATPHHGFSIVRKTLQKNN